MNRRTAIKGTRDRGAAAVEFALLLPVLLLLIFGVIDFGRALNAQITLTQAAREGARLAALGQPASTVASRATSAATGLSPVTVTQGTATGGVVTWGTACTAGAGSGVDAVVKTSYSFSFITPVGAIAGMFGPGGYGSAITLTAQGDMPCET